MTKARSYGDVAPGPLGPDGSGFGFVLQHLTPTVEAVGADMVTQVRFTGGRLHGDARHRQGVVRAVHATLGGRLFVLLDGHGGSLIASDAAQMGQAQPLVEMVAGNQ